MNKLMWKNSKIRIVMEKNAFVKSIKELLQNSNSHLLNLIDTANINNNDIMQLFGLYCTERFVKNSDIYDLVKAIEQRLCDIAQRKAIREMNLVRYYSFYYDYELLALKHRKTAMTIYHKRKHNKLNMLL